MKALLLRLMTALSIVWKLIPRGIRWQIFFAMLILESRGKNSQDALRSLFKIEDYLNLVINERAMVLGKGEHPKHRLIQYHQFFIRNLTHSQNILDIGCGYGAVARSIARTYPNSNVVGIDNDSNRFQQAMSSDNPPNLKFMNVDLHEFEPSIKFDTVILSNVLEHVTDRVQTLMTVAAKTRSSKFLIRVPLYERHWTIPLREELNVSYFQDPDHKVEHKLNEFVSEIEASKLVVVSLETLWGEIWAVCANDE